MMKDEQGNRKKQRKNRKHEEKEGEKKGRKEGGRIHFVNTGKQKESGRGTETIARNDQGETLLRNFSILLLLRSLPSLS